jgi:hypothetical protein
MTAYQRTCLLWPDITIITHVVVTIRAIVAHGRRIIIRTTLRIAATPPSSHRGYRGAFDRVVAIGVVILANIFLRGLSTIFTKLEFETILLLKVVLGGTSSVSIRAIFDSILLLVNMVPWDWSRYLDRFASVAHFVATVWTGLSVQLLVDLPTAVFILSSAACPPSLHISHHVGSCCGYATNRSVLY